MDFSKVKEFNIPEGPVKELSINGQVVWKKAPEGILLESQSDTAVSVILN